MYRLQSFDGRHKDHFCNTRIVWCPLSMEGLGDKFVYLGTKTLEYKEGSYNRRHKKNTWRLGLFGDKVLPIAPDLWTYMNQWRKHESI